VEVPGAKSSVNEASFTGQTQERFFRRPDQASVIGCVLPASTFTQTHSVED
jgi:hypothetical protein